MRKMKRKRALHIWALSAFYSASRLHKEVNIPFELALDLDYLWYADSKEKFIYLLMYGARPGNRIISHLRIII